MKISNKDQPLSRWKQANIPEANATRFANCIARRYRASAASTESQLILSATRVLLFYPLVRFRALILRSALALIPAFPLDQPL
jgi:hypothetical protein